MNADVDSSAFSSLISFLLIQYLFWDLYICENTICYWPNWP